MEEGGGTGQPIDDEQRKVLDGMKEKLSNMGEEEKSRLREIVGDKEYEEFERFMEEMKREEAGGEPAKKSK